MAGTTTSFGGNANYWVLKLDGIGTIGAGCTLIATSNSAVANTGVTAVDSPGSENSTNANVAVTHILPQDTNATPTTQCSFP